jgi:hypothetical protein
MKRIFFWIILLLFAFAWIIFWLQYLNLTSYQFFAPKYENARREVFENTQSYTEWKRQELSKYIYEYKLTKDEDRKSALRFIILQSSANIDKKLLPNDIIYFIDSL